MAYMSLNGGLRKRRIDHFMQNFIITLAIVLFIMELIAFTTKFMLQ